MHYLYNCLIQADGMELPDESCERIINPSYWSSLMVAPISIGFGGLVSGVECEILGMAISRMVGVIPLSSSQAYRYIRKQSSFYFRKHNA